MFILYFYRFIYGFITAHDLASNINGVDAC
jgi:hypothetical protein